MTTFDVLILGHLFNGAASQALSVTAFRCRDSGLLSTSLPFIRLVGKLAPVSSKATKITENFSAARKCHWRPENSVIEDQLVSLTNCLEAGGFRTPAY